MTTETYTTPVVGAPTLPAVNLMPPEIGEQRRLRRLQFAMGGAVVAAFVVVGGLYTVAHSGVTAAQSELTQAQSEQSQLQHQLTSLQNVQDVYTQVSMRQQMLATAMGREVRWSRYLNDLSLRIPDNVWLTQVTATEADAAATSTSTQAAPGLTPGIGQIQFTGVAFSHDDVAAWLDSLAREKGFANPYFSNSAETLLGTRKAVNFSSTATLTDAALSGRYTKPAGS